jgi:hypothetical protein
VARLALQLEVVRVETDLWVVAVVIVEPDDVVHYLARLFTTYLTQPSICGQPIVYIRPPCFLPGWASVELFLVQCFPSSHRSGVSYTGKGKARLFDLASYAIIIPVYYVPFYAVFLTCMFWAFLHDRQDRQVDNKINYTP